MAWAKKVWTWRWSLPGSPATDRQRRSKLWQHGKVKLREVCTAAARLAGHWGLSWTIRTAKRTPSADCNSCARRATRWQSIS